MKTGLNGGRGDDHDLDVSITEYPDYYQVKSSYKDLAGYYEKLSESQNYHKFPVFRQKIQGKITYSLYLDLYGNWIINNVEGAGGKGFANSLGRGQPLPDISKGWKIFEEMWKIDEKLKVTPLNPFYPWK